MSPGDTVGRLGRVPADSPCSCIRHTASRAVPTARLPGGAGFCLPSHAEPSSSHCKSGPREAMGKRRPHSPRSSLGGGVGEEWDRVFPPAPPTLYVWPVAVSHTPTPLSLLRFREEKRRMRCLRMRIEGWKLPQLNFKNPWLVAMVT